MTILKIYKKLLKKIFYRRAALLALYLIWGYHELNSRTGLEDFLSAWLTRR